MKILVYPDLRKHTGGPASFQANFLEYLYKNDINYSFRLLDIFRTKKKDICVLAINTGKYFFILWFFYLLGYKTFYRVGSVYPSNIFTKRSIKEKLYNFIIFYLLKISLRYFSKGVVFQSRVVKDEWQNELNFIFKESIVIYNSTPYLNSGKEQSDIENMVDELKTLSENPGNVVILVVETNHPERENHLGHLLAEMIPFAVTLVLVGNCSWVHSKVNYNLIKCGFISKEQVSRIAEYCTFFLNVDIFPSGCPNSVIEAMSYGLPVLCYQNTSAHELIDEDCGFAVKPNTELLRKTGLGGNYEELIGGVEFIHQNSHKMREAALIRSEIFKPEVIFSSYINFLKK
jgi:glycosyltransferase involved in cell wall biosynthesis